MGRSNSDARPMFHLSTGPYDSTTGTAYELTRRQRLLYQRRKTAQLVCVMLGDKCDCQIGVQLSHISANLRGAFGYCRIQRRAFRDCRAPTHMNLPR